MKRLTPPPGKRPSDFPAPVLWFGKTFAKLWGWKFEGAVPNYPKFVLVAVPHTSNWDALVFFMVVLMNGMRSSWIVKNDWTNGIVGPIVRFIGGVGVNRGTSWNVVSQMADRFKEREKMVLVVTPEGTRGKSDYWRPGFYWIAHEANVPIALAYVDYQKRIVGIDPVFETSGDIDADIQALFDFYEPYKASGKYPEKTGAMRLKPARVPREGAASAVEESEEAP